MGILDKFLDIMKLNDDEDYDEDDIFDEEYDEEEPPKKSGLFSRKSSSPEPEEDDFAVSAKASNNVTPMRQNKKRGVSMEVCVVKPTSVEDSREITETLLAGRTVILNLEGLDLEVAQRIIDFTSGATYAIAGNLQKISNYIFIATPASVDISGDLQDTLAASFDM